MRTVAGAVIWSRMRCTTGRMRCLTGPRALRGATGLGGAGEVEEVGALGVVELKRAGERLEHELGDAADVAALQALVVLDADAGQRGDLLAPQPRHAPLAVARQAGLLGRDLRPPGGQELGDVAVVPSGRGYKGRARSPLRGALLVPLSGVSHNRDRAARSKRSSVWGRCDVCRSRGAASTRRRARRTGSPATSTSTRSPRPPARSTFAAALVHFTPGARTAWHTHPHGQTIFVTEGVGLCQRDGGPVEVIRPGDRVFFEPGENHWHGAAPNRFMAHIAMQQTDESGSPVTWGRARDRRRVRRRADD